MQPIAFKSCVVGYRMPEEIILLTGDAEVAYLENILWGHNQKLNLVHARTLGELEDLCCDDRNHSRRLISFCSSVIVPVNILNILMKPAYNFHPGPPTYPGSHPASFAIYDNAQMFGATAHEMAAKVDTGPIVAVDWFQVPDNLRFTDLELKAYESLLRLFARLASHLATNDTPLEHLDVKWAGKVSTTKDVKLMREISESMSESEIKRRFRAFG